MNLTESFMLGQLLTIGEVSFYTAQSATSANRILRRFHPAVTIQSHNGEHGRRTIQLSPATDSTKYQQFEI